MIYNLHVIRALAAINVVLYHILQQADHYGISPTYMKFLRAWGANGVDIFFVMSGFVLVYSQSRNPRGAWSFAVNRFLRIVPLYWILTIVFTTVVFLAPQLLKDGPVSWDFLATSLAFISRHFGYEFPVIFVGWTLEFEMLFYLVVATGFIFSRGAGAYIFTAVLFVFLTVMNWSDAVLIEFIFGIGIGLFYLKHQVFAPGKWIFWTGLVLLFASIAIDVETWMGWGRRLGEMGISASSNDIRVVLWGIPSAMIVFGCLYIRQLESRFLHFLGDASYSIFLVQAFTLPLCFMLTGRVLRTMPGDIASALVLLVSVGAGIGVYYLVEKPLGTAAKSLSKKLGA
jgi:peptidoglycan/LPS O-acetylase OafA/YrhL